MNININLTPADFITLFGLGFFCVAIFLVTGIMMVVTKNPNLVSKTVKFREEKLFVTIYGCVYIVFSLITAVLLAIAYFTKNLTLNLFLWLAITILTMLILQHFLQKKFKVK